MIKNIGNKMAVVLTASDVEMAGITKAEKDLLKLFGVATQRRKITEGDIRFYEEFGLEAPDDGVDNLRFLVEPSDAYRLSQSECTSPIIKELFSALHEYSKDSDDK